MESSSSVENMSQSDNEENGERPANDDPNAGVDPWTLEPSDFKIIVKYYEDQVHEFKVLKSVLKRNSPVFNAMLEVNMQESISGEVPIREINPDIMRLTLSHMYGRTLKNGLNIKKIFDLLRVADIYQIDTLKKECTSYTAKNLITVDNCPTIVMNLPTFATEQEDLIEACLQIISENSDKYFHDMSLMNIPREFLERIVKQEKFVMNSELDLIRFVARWAVIRQEEDETISIREIVGENIKYNIRFLTLSKEELMNSGSFTLLYTSAERNEIYRTLSANKHQQTYSGKYNELTRKKRCFISKEFNRLTTDNPFLTIGHCLVNLASLPDKKESRVTSFGTECCFSFEIDQENYMLLGIQFLSVQEMYARSQLNYRESELVIKISQGDNEHETILFNSNGDYGYLSNINTTIAWLKTPLELKIKQTYTLNYFYCGQIVIQSYELLPQSNYQGEFNIITKAKSNTLIGPIKGLVIK